MDESLVEINKNSNSNLMNCGKQANNNNVSSCNGDMRIIEFIQDLKEAIQSGEFQKHQKQIRELEQMSEAPNGSRENNDGECSPSQTQSISVISSLINVNNLSNQTFSYIISWLKQQQIQIEESRELNQAQTSNPDSDSQKNQPQFVDNEKEKLYLKYKNLEEENLELKTKLLSLKSNAFKSNAYQTTNGLDEKDLEIERLKRIVDELVKANDEKDKKVDELTKQVLRFKRIQEIVLSAQTSVSTINKNKNGVDLDFDTNSDSNSIPSMNGSADELISVNNQTKQPTKTKNPSQNGSNTATPSHQTNKMVAASTNQLISSCSLSSSLSSTSSSSSSSSILVHNNNNNVAGLAAPLAAITELAHFNSPKTTSSHGSPKYANTLPTHFASNECKKELDPTSVRSYRNGSRSCLSSSSHNNSSNTIVNDDSLLDSGDSEVTLTKARLNASMSSVEANYNKDLYKISKSKKGSVSNPSQNSDLKYSSTCSMNLRKSCDQKKQSSSQKSSPVHSASSSNKGLRNFFGKLIRTSLVNINESSFNSSIHNISESAQNKTAKVKLDELNSSSSFKRGGHRATANARLQNNNNHSVSNNSLLGARQVQSVDTLTFAKYASAQVYEWLCKQGFDSYFTVNSDGNYVNKWIKNGLHLLQASQHDYEKELGIKNPLHRKKLYLLLQSMYNTAIAPELSNISCIDQLWVTKWLDDIGLPQYKDVFHEAKIDGLMLHHLSNEDFQHLNINSELHFLGIKRAIHVLRLNNYDAQCLRRRPSGDDRLDKSEVMLWTNHRVMEWLRSIDLSEYAPNLRGSGVHGALMVFEARFNATVLADILAIPTSKTLLRRHLSTLFIDLIGPQMYQLKRDAETQSGYQALSASSKIKHTKRTINVSGIFSHKRTKSQDSRDFLSGSIFMRGHSVDPTTFDNTSKNFLINTHKSLNKEHESNNNNNSQKALSSSMIGHSSTLPSNSTNASYSEANSIHSPNAEKDSFKAKLSILSQENLPTSIV